MLKSSADVGGSCREQSSGGEPEPSQVRAEPKRVELGGAVKSGRVGIGSSCTELSPVSKAAAGCDTDSLAFRGLSAIVFC